MGMNPPNGLLVDMNNMKDDIREIKADLKELVATTQRHYDARIDLWRQRDLELALLKTEQTARITKIELEVAVLVRSVYIAAVALGVFWTVVSFLINKFI